MQTLPSDRGKTLMVVDDEEASLLLFRKILQQQGYQVLFARGTEAALNVCRMHTGPLDLLITDVVMPGLSGEHLADQLRSRRPGVQILFISGIMNAAAIKTGQPFLPKPFTSEQLVSKVRELLPPP